MGDDMDNPDDRYYGNPVSKIEVKYRPNSKIRLSLEDRNVDSLGDNRPRPRKDDKEHYVKM